MRVSGFKAMKAASSQNFDRLRELVRRIIDPIRAIDENTSAKQDFLFSAQRAVGAEELPAPYLIYFLLVDLLGFKDLGRFEKLAWSIPIDFEGKAFLIEHRKFGAGVFAQNEQDFESARRIALLVRKGVRCARPYFKWKAEQAVHDSKFNVVNNAGALFGRYRYLKGQYQKANAEAERRKDEVITKSFKGGTSYTRPYYRLIEEARWLAIAAVEAFFSWTEHIFVLMAILKGSITTGAEFAAASGAEWSIKFKHAIEISDPEMKTHFDRLLELRRQVRNFVSHGAFGKNGETLYFHSSAGAVPVLLDVTEQRPKFFLREGLQFDPSHALEVMETFISALSNGSGKAAWVYIQDFGLPLIITMAQDGTYERVMTAPEAMAEFALELARRMDDAANMDW